MRDNLKKRGIREEKTDARSGLECGYPKERKTGDGVNTKRGRTW